MNTPTSSVKPIILVAPLDWGLGHATRCIPIIYALLHHHCNVVLAGEGKVKHLLTQEFPELPFLPLTGYNIQYARKGQWLPWTISLQIPKILSVIQYENARVKEWVKTHKIDGIISDNRYGLYHSSVPSVFVTHQLRVQSGISNAIDSLIQRYHYRHIQKFRECWVPDSRLEPSLSGKLGHPLKVPEVPVHYLGPLSRFSSSVQGAGKRILILLSGPEPQRTQLEQLIAEQLKSYHEPVVLVRGLPGGADPIFLPPHVTIFNHLPAVELEKEIARAAVVVARSGYSTVMDLMAMKKKSILIPTPGQTEQIYLGAHLMEQRLAVSVAQKDFQLSEVMAMAEVFPYASPPHHANNLSVFIAQWLNGLKRF